ncbi:hypothetical protein D3C80_1480340 [compost metagenome]
MLPSALPAISAPMGVRFLPSCAASSAGTAAMVAAERAVREKAPARSQDLIGDMLLSSMCLIRRRCTGLCPAWVSRLPGFHAINPPRRKMSPEWGACGRELQRRRGLRKGMNFESLLGCFRCFPEVD